MLLSMILDSVIIGVTTASRGIVRYRANRIIVPGTTVPVAPASLAYIAMIDML